MDDISCWELIARSQFGLSSPASWWKRIDKTFKYFCISSCTLAQSMFVPTFKVLFDVLLKIRPSSFDEFLTKDVSLIIHCFISWMDDSLHTKFCNISWPDEQQKRKHVKAERQRKKSPIVANHSATLLLIESLHLKGEMRLLDSSSTMMS